MRKLRIVKVAVQLVAVADDGENITELDISPVSVPWAQWQAFIDGGFGEAIATVRAQVETPDPEPSNT